jgi:Glycosyltransferase family 87
MRSIRLFRSSTPFMWFSCILVLLAIGYYVLETVNGRNQMADFRVYYDACRHFLDGNTMYGEAFGVSSGFYKYSPFAVIPFIPLAILPYGLASVLYYLIVIFLFVEVSARVFEILDLPKNGKIAACFLIIVSLFAADHIERELHLGNVNLFLLLLCLLLMEALAKSKRILSGVLIAILLLFKPHFIALVPLLIWRIRWRELLIGALVFVIGLILPAIYVGWQNNMSLLGEWGMAIKDHNLALENSPNTVYGLLNMACTGIGIKLNSLFIIGISLLLVAGFSLLYLLRSRAIQPDIQRWFLEIFFVVAFIPNLTHTDTEHFIWSWPLIAFVVSIMLRIKFYGYKAYILLLILAFIPYVLNSPDIVGKNLRHFFDEGGGLGMANLVIILLAFSLVVFHRMQMKQLDTAK